MELQKKVGDTIRGSIIIIVIISIQLRSEVTIIAGASSVSKS